MIKNIISNTFLPLLVMLGLISCSNLEDLNKNTKAIDTASADALANSATKSLVDQLLTQDVNYNNSRLWIEHWTETSYPDEANYDVDKRSVSKTVFREIYVYTLSNYKKANELLEEELKITSAPLAPLLINKKSTIEILTVLAYSSLVEDFGDVPYSQALNVENDLSPKYDLASEIYMSLITRLKAAIDAIDTSAKGMEIDNIYAGDMTAWKKFAASLYLRMGMVLADVEPALSKTIVEEAVKMGVFLSNEDNALYKYVSTSPNRNPIYNAITALGRKDYVAAENLVQKLNELNDPRRSAFYDQDDGAYKGGIVGKVNTYSDFSPVSAAVGSVADRPGRIMDFSEISFLLAEASQRGYDVGGTAQTHYEAAIKASINFWGGTNSNATDYIAQTSVSYDAARYKELIGTQMWIAMYDRGEAAWLHWRRYDFPSMRGAVEGKTSDKQPPRRITYPVSEQKLNATNMEEAATRIGGDKLETKLFWDKN